MGGISAPRLGRRLAPGPYVPADAPRSPCRCALCTSRTRPSAGLQESRRSGSPHLPSSQGNSCAPSGLTVG
eukprot:3582008-Pyramimonas_sp.AAC.1